VLAPHEWYCTEGARTVAAFGNLQIGEVAGIGENPLANKLVFVIGLKDLEHPGQVSRTEPGIYFRNLLLEIVLIALGKAAGNVYFVDDSLFLGVYIPENGIDLFLLGVVDETTSIDDHHAGVVRLGFVNSVDAVAPQLCEQYLGVDQVLGTTQCDNIDLRVFVALCFHFSIAPTREGVILTLLVRYLLFVGCAFGIVRSLITDYQMISEHRSAESSRKNTKNWPIRNLAFSPLNYLYSRVDNHEEIKLVRVLLHNCRFLPRPARLLSA